jgi:hypothetical protein
MKKNPPFIFAIILTLLGHVIFSPFRLFVLSPFLVYVYYRFSFKRALGIALGCGFIIDVFSSEARLVMYTATFFCTALLLYRQKRHFFEDSGLPFAVFTVINSFFLTLICCFMSLVFEGRFFFSVEFCAMDLFLMPIFDGVYGFLWFSSLLKLYMYIRKNKIRKVKIYEK